MIPISIENIGEVKELSEQELQAVYLYLDMYLDTMSDEDKMHWLKILTAIDKQFYDDTGDGADQLRDVQSPEASA